MGLKENFSYRHNMIYTITQKNSVSFYSFNLTGLEPVFSLKIDLFLPN